MSLLASLIASDLSEDVVWIGAVALYLVSTIMFLVVSEVQYQVLRILHMCGVLTRHQEPPSSERNLGQALIGISSVTIPLALYRSLNFQSLVVDSVARFDVLDAVVFQTVLLLAVDAWYFWGHRYMHRNKFLWNHVHSHHHEMKNLNVYATAYAVFVENLLLIAPVIILATEAYCRTSAWLERPVNSVSIALAVSGQACIFNLGHCGMIQHWALYLMMPPTTAVHRCFGEHALQAQDHEVHHLCPTNNFSLNFRFWDKYMGSYRSMETPTRKKSTST